MDSLNVEIDDFRKQLLRYLLVVRRPLAIVCGSDTIGYYIPVPAGVSPDNAEALRADGSALDAMLEASGIDPENIISEFSDRRRN